MASNLVPIIGCVMVLGALGILLWPQRKSILPTPPTVDIHSLLAQLIAAAPNEKSRQLLREVGKSFYEVDDAK